MDLLRKIFSFKMKKKIENSKNKKQNTKQNKRVHTEWDIIAFFLKKKINKDFDLKDSKWIFEIDF